MRVASAMVVVLALTAPLAGALSPTDYNQQARSNALRSAERTWKSLDKPPDSLSSRELFTAALAYCEGRTNLDRLQRLFETAVAMQDRNPTNRGYGNFRWSWGHSQVMDYNAVDFCMQTASMLWIHHSDRMPAKAREVLRELIRYGLEGLRRHRVTEHYTNIAFMNAGNLILMGEAMDDPASADEGYARLDRCIVSMWEIGTHEYNSPTYYGVDLDDLLLIEAFCRRDRGREQARTLLEYFWTDIALNWFEGSQKMAGTRSRDYDYLRGLGVLDQHLLANNWIGPGAGLAPNNLIATFGRWQAAAAARELAARPLPRYVQQIWGPEMAHGRAHWLAQDVTLSTSGASYGGRMDLPLTVDLPGPRERPRGYFIADGREDPYGKFKIPEGSGAHSKTLHLNPFWAAVQNNQDSLALVVYREKDLNPTNRALQSHFVFPADVKTIYVGDKQISPPANGKGEFPVPQDTPVVLCQGSAAVGVRIPWTRGFDGRPGTVALVFDGNPYGAARITVNHHTTTSRSHAGTDPGAVFRVRVGSGLEEADLTRWRADFAAARVAVQATRETIDANAHGGLRITGSAPFQSPTRLKPAYPRSLLAVDGNDVGRKLLERIEPVKSFAADDRQTAPVAVTANGIFWEAERARLLPPMSAGQEVSASGGKFIWMPAAPGERASSSSGRAAYRLQVTRAGTYYLWGRVLSPTPENDSFFVRAIHGHATVLPQTAWPLGTRKQWQWVRLNQEGTTNALPLALPEGDIALEIRVREAGSRLDRLLLTPIANTQPK